MFVLRCVSVIITAQNFVRNFDANLKCTFESSLLRNIIFISSSKYVGIHYIMNQPFSLPPKISDRVVISHHTLS